MRRGELEVARRGGAELQRNDGCRRFEAGSGRSDVEADGRTMSRPRHRPPYQGGHRPVPIPPQITGRPTPAPQADKADGALKSADGNHVWSGARIADLKTTPSPRPAVLRLRRVGGLERTP